MKSYTDLPEVPRHLPKKEQIEFMFNAALDIMPQVTYVPEMDPADMPGVKAIYYSGMNYKGVRRRTFAYIGFPEGASEANPVPAMVLVHGGGGWAFKEWVKKWVDAGYAAIAMDNTGNHPVDPNNPYVHDELAAMTNDNMGNCENDDIEEMWMYHAVSLSIFAHNILIGDKRVKQDSIGITGISWGGVITCIALGYDTRYAFAIPVYGCGYLNEALTWMKPLFSPAQTDELFGAAHRFDRINIPVLWLNGANDNAFSINSTDKSFAHVKNSTLAIQRNLLHGHIEGWDPPEILRFANSIVSGKKGLIQPLAHPTKEMGRNFELDLYVPDDLSNIKVIAQYITQPLSYTQKEGQTSPNIDQEWQECPGRYENGKAYITLPEEAAAYFIEFSGQDEAGTTYLSSSRFITL